MKDLLESLEMSEEVKTSIAEAFDKQVQESSEAKIQEALEVQKEELIKLGEAFAKEHKEELKETTDLYLSELSEEVTKAQEPMLEAEVAKAKYSALVEGITAIVEAAGIDILALESKDSEKEALQEAEIKETTAKVDSLIKENADLRAQVSNLSKAGLLKELQEGMTETQKDSFMKLSENVEFVLSESAAFVASLTEIKESLKTVPEVKEVIEESAPAVSKYSHMC